MALVTVRDPLMWEFSRAIMPLLAINSFAIIYAFFHCPKGTQPICDKYVAFTMM